MNFNFTNAPDYQLNNSLVEEMINLYGVQTKFLLVEKINIDDNVFGDYSHLKTDNAQIFDNRVTLYIAEHNKTGLKYFGKTEKWFTQKDLQENYHGSGKHWRSHIKRHGDDVTMKIYGVFEKSEVANVALEFSEINDIVNSRKWANCKPENGLDGNPKGIIFSEEHKAKLRKPKSEDHKRKLSKASNNSGERNGMYAKHHSEKTRKLISERVSGYKHTEEAKLLISLSSSGENNPMYGKHHSEEVKERISRSKIGVKQEIIQCPHCQRSGGRSNMNRYHFNNCKFKGDLYE